MSEDLRYDCYPARIVFVSALQTFISHALGTVVIYLVGLVYAIGFVILVAFTIIMSPLFRCRFCYYMGRRCSFGLGLLAGMVTKRGSNENFGRARYVYPMAVLGFITTALPIIALAYLLATDFSRTLLFVAVAYVLLALAPGFYLRPRVFCSHCRQGEIGCPAYERMKKGNSGEFDIT